MQRVYVLAILPPVTALTVGLPAQRAIAQRFSALAQSGGPGMSALRPLLGAKQTPVALERNVARPLPHIVDKEAAHIRVNRVVLAAGWLLPVYPQEQTFALSEDMSQMGQRTKSLRDSPLRG